jgi:photosystem II stability/assembly factor-like uncharacterized protein
MKPLPTKRWLLPAAVFCIALLAGILYKPKHPKKENPEKEAYSGEYKEKETGADKQLAMWFQARAYPDPFYFNDKYQSAWQTFLESRKKANEELTRTGRTAVANWTYIGPNTSIGGRMLCIAIDPNNSNNLWAGSASGGMWRSTNAGSSWTYVPIPNVPVLGVSSILINPSNSNIMYAGTGEVYRVDTSNIGFNVWKARGTYGVGILKSTDGGVNWTQALVRSTPQLFGVQMLEFHPSNSNTIFAAATDGLYRSTDAGVNWTQILTKIYVTDVAVNPANPDEIVVGVGNLVNNDKGIYRTTNGANASPTWTKITSGLPASFSGFIRLDNLGSGELVAGIGITSSTANDEVFRSTDFGLNWTALSGSGHCGGQYWFSHDLAINPFTADSIMITGVSGYRYEVSSGNRTTISATVHADMHDAEYDPVHRGRIYIACDGGIYRSTNGGVSWSNMNNGLSATQFYASIAASPTTANVYIGGLQDNNPVIYNGATWTQFSGGDGGPAAFHNNGTTVIFSHDARNVYHSTNTAGTWAERLENLGLVYNEDRRTGFMAPVAISKSNPSVMYVASDNLHISTNAGVSFTRNTPGSMTRPVETNFKTAIALAVSATDPDKVYVSTSPFAQNANNTLVVNPPPNVLRSLNASNNASYTFSSIKNNLPDRFVMDFAISPTNDDSVFVVLGGFEDAGGSHIFVTGNGGATWSDIGTSATLPDVPFNAILIDPLNPQILYAGCDFGVYASPDRGATWQDYNNGFTGTNLVVDLQMTFDNLLLAATHGRGAATSPRFGGTLPVFFSLFKGVHQSGINKLEWRTTNEVDLLRFELEKSTDGRNYSRIASFNPGNNNGSFTYTFDDAVSSSVAVYYYRVKAVELDGTFKYSPVVSLQVNGKKQFRVLNNPFTDYITIISLLNEKQTVAVNLFDAQGKLVKKKQFDGDAGSNSFIFDQLSALPKGIYILEAIMNRQRHTEKLLKN